MLIKGVIQWTQRGTGRLRSSFIWSPTALVGTTVFPQVDRPEGDAWCDTVKCKEDNGQEVEWLEVQGKVGRAIFWHNLDPDGNPDPDTLHAGTPVVHRTKVGLNIWTRENPYRQW